MKEVLEGFLKYCWRIVGQVLGAGLGHVWTDFERFVDTFPGVNREQLRKINEQLKFKTFCLGISRFFFGFSTLFLGLV